MSAHPLLDRFDTAFDQVHRLELQPVDRTPVDLRASLLESPPKPWSVAMPSSTTERSARWFWMERREASGNEPGVRVLLHEIAGRLRVTNVDGAGDGFDLAARNRATRLFRDEVVAPLEHAGRVVVHESGPRGDLRNWIGEDAVDALARFALAAHRSTGSGHPPDAERWNAFLVAALPVRDGTGFADALRSVLITNGWSEDSAQELAVQAEQANELLTAYRVARG